MTPFRSKKLPMFWWTGPATRPPGLGLLLEAHGLKHAEDFPGMAMSLGQLKDAPSGPAGLSIQRVLDLVSLQRWGDVAVKSFGLPDFVAEPGVDVFRSAGLEAASPLRCYLGILNGEAVAASTMFLGAGVAGIYNVGTLPAARRRGIGAAMTRVPLLEARERGHRVAILHASALGKPVYEALGFREYCTLGSYMWMPSPA
jgi:GNAT superfamily N-acetyltransferase